MRILALDIADACGWAYGDIDHIESGTWKLKLRSDDSVGMRLLKLRRHLNAIREYGISLVVFERVAGQYKTDIARCSEKAGVVMEWCEARGIPYYALSASEVKKFATGKGRASKEDMLGAAIHKFGVDCGKDHNQADALAIWHMAYSQYGDDDDPAVLSRPNADPIDDTCDPAEMDSRGTTARSNTSFPSAAAGKAEPLIKTAK